MRDGIIQRDLYGIATSWVDVVSRDTVYSYLEKVSEYYNVFYVEKKAEVIANCDNLNLSLFRLFF